MEGIAEGLRLPGRPRLQTQQPPLTSGASALTSWHTLLTFTLLWGFPAKARRVGSGLLIQPLPLPLRGCPPVPGDRGAAEASLGWAGWSVGNKGQSFVKGRLGAGSIP